MERFKKIETGWKYSIDIWSAELKAEEVYEEDFKDYKLLAFDWFFNSDTKVCVVLDKNEKVVFIVEHHTEPKSFIRLKYEKDCKYIKCEDNFKRIVTEFMLTNDTALCTRIEEILTKKEKIRNDK